jgi:hypothetical protein
MNGLSFSWCLHVRFSAFGQTARMHGLKTLKAAH